MTPQDRVHAIVEAQMLVGRAKRARDGDSAVHHLCMAVDNLTKVLLELTGACPQCHGAGSYPPPTRKICDLCGGNGVLESFYPEIRDSDETAG